MRLALVNGMRAPAVPHGRGMCTNPICSRPMIARCGRVKVWHWAHKRGPHCDSWYESETAWHRDWKNKFPVDWQEIIQIDPLSGEVHIADVKTVHGVVVEFQHSPLAPSEMRAREAFYGDMLWVIDGRRGALDAQFFQMGLHGPLDLEPLAYQIDWLSRGQLLRNWSEAQAKVYLDFGHDVLWRLIYFDPIRKAGVVGPAVRTEFVQDLLIGKSIQVLANGPSLPAPLRPWPKQSSPT